MSNGPIFYDKNKVQELADGGASLALLGFVQQLLGQPHQPEDFPLTVIQGQGVAGYQMTSKVISLMTRNDVGGFSSLGPIAGVGATAEEAMRNFALCALGHDGNLKRGQFPAHTPLGRDSSYFRLIRPKAAQNVPA
ncbi:MAG: hypothetical protein ABTQ34_03645 [Bdellovibrionales bacterium]